MASLAKGQEGSHQVDKSGTRLPLKIETQFGEKQGTSVVGMTIVCGYWLYKKNCSNKAMVCCQ